MKDKKFDNSVYIPQKSKIKGEIKIRSFPWTEKQKKLIETALDKNSKVIFIKAPSGVGKTLIATYCALKKLSDGQIGEIIYLRSPIESATKSIGFLTGDKNAKMEVYGLPLYDQMNELINKETIQMLLKDNRLNVESIGFIKGRTFHSSCIICDESEDLTISELRLLISRLSKFSILFIIGDINQTNIKYSGFNDVADAFNDKEGKENGIHVFEFTNADSMRCPLTKYILDKFDKLNKKMFD